MFHFICRPSCINHINIDYEIRSHLFKTDPSVSVYACNYMKVVTLFTRGMHIRWVSISHYLAFLDVDILLAPTSYYLFKLLKKKNKKKLLLV